MTFYCNKCKKHFSGDSPICPFCGYGDDSLNSDPSDEFEVLDDDSVETNYSDTSEYYLAPDDSNDSDYHNRNKKKTNNKVISTQSSSNRANSNPESEKTYGIIILVSGVISFVVALLSLLFFPPLLITAWIFYLIDLIISTCTFVFALRFKRAFGKNKGLSKLGILLSILSLIIIGIEIVLYIIIILIPYYIEALSTPDTVNEFYY